MDDPVNSGLQVARQIGMISYRTSKGYHAKFGRRRGSLIRPMYLLLLLSLKLDAASTNVVVVVVVDD